MMDPRTNLCFGCGRTLPEIARWHRMENAERLARDGATAGADGGGGFGAAGDGNRSKID